MIAGLNYLLVEKICFLLIAVNELKKKRVITGMIPLGIDDWKKNQLAS